MANIEITTMTEEQRKGIAGAIRGDLIEVETNDDKLDASPAIGDLYLITDEGGRIERYVGPDPSEDSSWVVERNTVALTVENTTGDDVTVDGVVVEDSTASLVGWVDPDNVTFDIVAAGTFTAGFANGATTFADVLSLAGEGSTSAPLPIRTANRAALSCYIF